MENEFTYLEGEMEIINFLVEPFCMPRIMALIPLALLFIIWVKNMPEKK